MEIKKFLGLRNASAGDRLPVGALQAALDVDVDDSGALRSRLGQTSVSAVASHSLWAGTGTCLVAQGTVLKRLNDDNTLTTLRTLTYGGPLSYVESNGVVYYSNGIDAGRVVAGRAGNWGVRPPPAQPGATASAGSLPAGRYLYAMTYVRSDGLESGTPAPGVVDVPASGSITFSSCPVSADADVVAKALYISGANGTELYRVAVVPAATASYSYRNQGTDLGVALEAGFVEQAPPGSIVEIHASVAYVVDGSVAWASDPYNLERFRRDRRFLQLPGQISMFGAVADGIYAATEAGTWFFEGTDPEQMAARKVLTYGAIPGTMVKLDGEELLPEEARSGASQTNLLWISPFGAILGAPGGQLKSLTEGQYSLPTARRGAGLFRVGRGYSTYVFALQGTGAPLNAHE